MSQQAPVFPKVPLQGLRFRDFEAIKNLRLDLTRSFSRVFQGLFLPIRADFTKLRNVAFRLLGASSVVLFWMGVSTTALTAAPLFTLKLLDQPRGR